MQFRRKLSALRSKLSFFGKDLDSYLIRHAWFCGVDSQRELEGKYSLESTDPRESEIRAHLRP